MYAVDGISYNGITICLGKNIRWVKAVSSTYNNHYVENIKIHQPVWNCSWLDKLNYSLQLMFKFNPENQPQIYESNNF